MSLFVFQKQISASIRFKVAAAAASNSIALVCLSVLVTFLFYEELDPPLFDD